ncbi:CFI-box-CTERM domain-containing protein [Luteibacter sp. 9133]|uniref:CFI-box-CTERM domain-containing protein n=1 Tax=Luteibacter sp. 9133 TaxID=1500891 RepID=UPI0005BDC308|nr:CFI-box-CTERM domain-containing protein [Luteibacter sp. 9133]
MPFLPVVCSSCGKSIQIPDDIDHAVCMYCGSSIATRGITQVTVGPNLENLLALANAAHEAGNHQEAYDFANRVLEFDARNRIAWFIKGRAAGWLSSLKSYRLQETRTAFNHVLLATAAHDIETREMLSDELNSIATALFNLSTKHAQKFASVDGTFQDHLTLCVEVREGYEMAARLSPDNPVPLENLLSVCEDNITGVTYPDPVSSNAKRVRVATPDYVKILRGVIDDVHGRLVELKPSATKPSPCPAQPGCFVVTATFGNEDNFPVRFLRDFRDDVLAQSSAGRAFSRWYYANGPHVAAWVARSSPRRAGALAVIVLPGLLCAMVWTGVTRLAAVTNRVKR